MNNDQPSQPPTTKDDDISSVDLIPDEQIQNLLRMVGGHATQQVPTVPQFTPPFKGLVITSINTNTTYEIGDFLGEGFFGTVFEATDVWKNNLAVKVLKPKGTYEQVQRAANNEFTKLLTLRHPNVTYVFDAFEFNNAFYIVTEKCFAPIESVFTLSKFTGALWVRPIARCLLQAINFLHVAGYVHQDIHAGNLFMTFHRNEMGDPESDSITFKLGDLGITKLFSEIDAANTLLNGSMFPPEFIDPKSFGDLGKTVDIYHAGLLLMQIIIGKPLTFTPEEILDGAPRKMAEQLDYPFDIALSKALRRRVSERTQSALELWNDLNLV
jgi:eukaryotic-like serine/threonine-protein kinase